MGKRDLTARVCRVALHGWAGQSENQKGLIADFQWRAKTRWEAQSFARKYGDGELLKNCRGISSVVDSERRGL